MRIEYLLRPQALQCVPSDTLMSIAQVMRGHQVSALAVLDEQRLVGMISHRDVVQAIAEGADPYHTQVGQYSTAVRHTAASTEDTSQVAQRMLENGLDHIPVLQGGAVVSVVPFRHVVAVEPGTVAKQSISTQHAAAAPPPRHGRMPHPPALRRAATRLVVRCRPCERSGPPTPHMDNGDPAHIGDAGWWLEQAPSRSRRATVDSTMATH
jgi:CBS domain-containing protein